ncbi:MAG: glycoside hydrolase family 32 protein [Eubacteriales bacterium]|nr:glycoside hydrolase family 32 protein [Eubacteriales bacterium]
MILKITGPYLWMPVDKNAKEQKLHLYIEGKKIQEIDIRLGETGRGFYTAMDTSPYLGKEMTIEGEDETLLRGIFCWTEKPGNVYPFRPKLHFSPEVGWHNDPNGMVYADGVYHLYYQWNPYGVHWGNMHWGHVQSIDLIHWEYKPAALVPNELGTMYSGCGIVDKDNLAGCGENALLFYYTAAGGRNQWSRDAGNLFTQRLAYSVDGGETLIPSDKFLMEHMVNENRDPKVFYHDKSKAYIMVLYLDGNEFALYRSENLLEWKETQRLEIPGMWECPDLFELKVENMPGQSKWVFWSADGYYVVGNFDGFRFAAEGDRKMAYSTRLPYAAQTFSGTPGRVISMAWLRMNNDRGNYRGLMSLPTELFLINENGEYVTGFRPAEEISGAEGESQELTGETFAPEGKAVRLYLTTKEKSEGEWKLQIGNLVINVDFGRGIFNIGDQNTHMDIANVGFDREKSQEIIIIIDQEAIEFFGGNGTIYGIAETEEDILGKVWNLTVSKNLDAVCRWCSYSV